MVLVLDHLWGHILKRTAERIPLLHVVSLHAPPEIANLDNISILDQDVLRLDISMDQALLVQIVNSRAHLDEEVKCRIFAQVFFFPDQIK